MAMKAVFLAMTGAPIDSANFLVQKEICAPESRRPLTTMVLSL